MSEENKCYTEHNERDYTVKNVPAFDIEGIGIVYSAKVMYQVNLIVEQMEQEGLKEVEFSAYY